LARWHIERQEKRRTDFDDCRQRADRDRSTRVVLLRSNADPFQ